MSSPTTKTYGPLPPSQLLDAKSKSDSGQESINSHVVKQHQSIIEATSNDTYGPMLPPSCNTTTYTSDQDLQLQSTNKAQHYGPALPPGYTNPQHNDSDHDTPSQKKVKYIGPALPDKSSSHDDNTTDHQGKVFSLQSIKIAKRIKLYHVHI